jgi:hypothetical protein
MTRPVFEGAVSFQELSSSPAHSHAESPPKISRQKQKGQLSAGLHCCVKIYQIPRKLFSQLAIEIQVFDLKR